MATEEILETASRLGIDLSQVDLDSIRLPPGEDFGIKSDDEDLNEEDRLEFDTGFGSIIVVDNLPVVPKEKFEKLEGVVRKIYGQIGVIKEDGLWMPIDPATQKTLGYCFIEYNTPQEAELAREKTNNYKLDKSHVFAINMFDDREKFLKVPDEWAPPETKPYTPGSVGACGFFVWVDPPLCARAKQIIPRMLRRTNELQGKLQVHRRREKWFIVCIVISWIFLWWWQVKYGGNENGIDNVNEKVDGMSMQLS
ncbi:Eukaryotic translation initiation factor 3 subunit B like [Actinidia chinensis var. chinensis]|uniref:Eukaryotic translation initiation factor 3 subunit B like n=1 Tax=Actinidia chinensis var. chinensis TaxID=1590841 RepID=A0A2R6QPW0_ACTCC|nr:Eukaryotic translation initiation factor 3 subunit B like [Actinidia chinensis var. chinensis]